MFISCGSLCYVVLEFVVLDIFYYGFVVDIWFCGVIFYVMFVGYFFYDDDFDNFDVGNVVEFYCYIMNIELYYLDYVLLLGKNLF